MQGSNRNVALGGLLLLIAAGVILFLVTQGNTSKPPPSGPGYYSGPMRNKANPNIWGDDTGKQVPAPAGTVPFEGKSSTKSHSVTE